MAEWYEQLNLEEDPFQDKDSFELIGYEDYIEEMLYRIEAGDILFVEGLPGLGKTALLRRAIAHHKGQGKVLYINCRDIKQDWNIEEVLVRRHGLWGRLLKKKPKGIILLVDEVHELTPKNMERLKYFYDQNYLKAVVFTGTSYEHAKFSPSLKDRVSKVVTLRELTDDEAIDIVQTRLDSMDIIPEEVLREVFVRAKKNTKAYLQHCEALCQYAVEHNGGKVTLDHLPLVLGSPTDQKKDEKPESPKASASSHVEPRKEDARMEPPDTPPHEVAPKKRHVVTFTEIREGETVVTDIPAHDTPDTHKAALPKEAVAEKYY